MGQPRPVDGGSLVAVVFYPAPGTDPEHAAAVQALLDRLTGTGPYPLTPPVRDESRPLAAVAAGTGSPTDSSGPAAPPKAAVLRIDTRSRTVTRLGEEVGLCRREFDLLLYLVEHPGRVFSRIQLLDAVWGDVFTGVRTVDVHIRRLRQKLGPMGLVTTVRGVGYRLASEASVTVLRDPVSVVRPTPPEPVGPPVRQWVGRQGAA